MRAIAELERHQQLIHDEIEEAKELVNLTVHNRCDLMAQARWRMFRLLRAYQIFKHSEIYDPTLRSSDRLRVERARTLKASCIATGEEYRLYTLQWSVDAMTRNWDDYRTALLSQVGKIESGLARERQEVITLLKDVPRTRSA